MKTPYLLQVPKTGPSRREKLAAFKTQHGIETHHCPSMSREEHPWLACLMPAARQFGYGVTAKSDLFECVSKVGRLLEEADVLVTGETETGAIRQLCDCNNIPCPW